MFFHHVPQSGYTTWTIVASRIGHSCNIHPRLGARFRVYCQLFPLSSLLSTPPHLLRTSDKSDARCLSYRWRCVKGIKSLSRSRLIYHAINVRARKSLAGRYGRRRGRNARSSFLKPRLILSLSPTTFLNKSSCVFYWGVLFPNHKRNQLRFYPLEGDGNFQLENTNYFKGVDENRRFLPLV